MASNDEAGELAELQSMLNGGTSMSTRGDRRRAQEEQQRSLPPPTKSELQAMAVEKAVEALVKYAHDERVVVGCCERWQSLGYGPGRRQSAADSGALKAIVGGMKANPSAALVQEKGALAIANICSGIDEQGLGRKALAHEAGCVEALVSGMSAFPDVAQVLSNSAAALGNICFAADESGLERKHAIFEAGALPLLVGGMEAFPEDVAVAENSAFALGNICRALGKVGNASSTGDFSAPELAPIDRQLKQRQDGVARKQAAADCGALGALVKALRTHSGEAGVQNWGARALSIITYESTPLREQAKAAGAKMQWLMGLSESMDQATKERAIPLSKTGRPTAAQGATGRFGGGAAKSVRGQSVRGY